VGACVYVSVPTAIPHARRQAPRKVTASFTGTKVEHVAENFWGGVEEEKSGGGGKSGATQRSLRAKALEPELLGFRAPALNSGGGDGERRGGRGGGRGGRGGFGDREGGAGRGGFGDREGREGGHRGGGGGRGRGGPRGGRGGRGGYGGGAPHAHEGPRGPAPVLTEDAFPKLGSA
jgi:hypothetical protein